MTKRKHLGEILMNHKIITQVQLDVALVEQKANPRPLGRILIQKGFITEKLLIQALAAQRGISAWHLDQNPPDPLAVTKISHQLCSEHKILPVQVKGDLLVLAMEDPDDIETIDLARNITGMRIEPVLVDATRLQKAIQAAETHVEKAPAQTTSTDLLVKKALETYGNENASLIRAEKAELEQVDTRPVVGLCNQIVLDAISRGASDIHIEPMDERIDVRLRIDGQLIDMMKVPQRIGPMLTTRFKIMAGIDIVETRIPQDGRISAELGNREVDLRVSVLPSYHGPRIVLRILDQGVGVRSLESLGFSNDNMQMFRKLIEKPYGLFLVTGPTGSGKTTTLYSALNELKTGRNNIMTCEDPVEYLIDGINQSQVNERVGLTFDLQLRSILRQDPDVVLVGEIRDKETASTAIRASMTGHMVVSTLHTNDAPSAIPRLLDMDVDPFLLSTSLIGVMSQRLLRVVCPHCMTNEPPSEDEQEILESVFRRSDIDRVPRSHGCPKCSDLGYRGRLAVHELLPITAEISNMVARQEPIEAIRQVATLYGYKTMQEDALRRILNNETTVQEAKRLISFETILKTEEHLQATALKVA